MNALSISEEFAAVQVPPPPVRYLLEENDKWSIPFADPNATSLELMQAPARLVMMILGWHSGINSMFSESVIVRTLLDEAVGLFWPMFLTMTVGALIYKGIRQSITSPDQAKTEGYRKPANFPEGTQLELAFHGRLSAAAGKVPPVVI